MRRQLRLGPGSGHSVWPGMGFPQLRCLPRVPHASHCCCKQVDVSQTIARHVSQGLQHDLPFIVKQAAAPARLQYIEEPVADPAAELAVFHAATGLPTALDESVDEGDALRWPAHSNENHRPANSVSYLGSSSLLGFSRHQAHGCSGGVGASPSTSE